MKNRKAGEAASGKLLSEAREKLDELNILLEPCFEVLSQPTLWPQENIGPEHIDFLERALNMARKFPEMFPAFIHLKTFTEDLSAIRELWDLLVEAEKTIKKIDGLLSLRGAQGMETALAYYRTLRIAAQRDLPMAQLLYEDLRSALPRSRGIRKLRGTQRLRRDRVK